MSYTAKLVQQGNQVAFPHWRMIESSTEVQAMSATTDACGMVFKSKASAIASISFYVKAYTSSPSITAHIYTIDSSGLPDTSQKSKSHTVAATGWTTVTFDTTYTPSAGAWLGATAEGPATGTVDIVRGQNGANSDPRWPYMLYTSASVYVKYRRSPTFVVNYSDGTYETGQAGHFVSLKFDNADTPNKRGFRYDPAEDGTLHGCVEASRKGDTCVGDIKFYKNGTLEETVAASPPYQGSGSQQHWDYIWLETPISYSAGDTIRVMEVPTSTVAQTTRVEGVLPSSAVREHMFGPVYLTHGNAGSETDETDSVPPMFPICSATTGGGGGGAIVNQGIHAIESGVSA